MFPFLPRRDAGVVATAALAMRLKNVDPDPKPNRAVPGGYTYLGQFIDHDITFDATSKIGDANNPDALVNFRTPRLDLDSLYGSGPADQPFLYDWGRGAYCGAKLLVGRNPQDDSSASLDLPRNHQGRALIGDPRNDEHLILAQLHLLFIKFHNRVVEELHRENHKLTANELFDAAHQAVRWHYQWIVTHDFLPRIVGRTLWDELLPRLTVRAPAPAHAADVGLPAIPIEFSAAAFRFGHSMVRSDYNVRESHIVPILPKPDGTDGDFHLGGFRRLPAELEIQWWRFFGPKATVDSMILDHRLSQRLYHLPPDNASLAQLNLERARALKLPCGLDVARAMGNHELGEAQLFPGRFWPASEDDALQRAAILIAPPLWFYLLREAAMYADPAAAVAVTGDAHGQCLGRTGGRIVAETLIGLLEADPTCYLYEPAAWQPAHDGGVFKEMADLVAFTLAGEPS